MATVAQIKAAQAAARASSGGLKTCHETSSGLLINEYRWGELEAFTPDGRLIEDRHLAH